MKDCFALIENEKIKLNAVVASLNELLDDDCNRRLETEAALEDTNDMYNLLSRNFYIVARSLLINNFKVLLVNNFKVLVSDFPLLKNKIVE